MTTIRPIHHHRIPRHPERAGAILLLACALPLLAAGCGGSQAADTAGGTSGTSGATSADEGASPAAGSSAPPQDLDLPPRFSELIRAEMREIEGAMQEELSHLARAEAAEGAELARRIEASFVMKARMSDAERKELRSLLPETFLAFDRDFHRRAGRMAKAFEAGDFDTAADLYAEMNRACVRCHSRFATERFPAFTGGGAGADGRGPASPDS